MRFIKVILLSASVVTLAGCATRSYVDESVARVESRLNAQEEVIADLSVTSRDALERATDAGVLAQGKFLYTVVLTDDGVTFESGNATLSPAGQQRLIGLANQLKSDNDN